MVIYNTFGVVVTIFASIGAFALLIVLIEAIVKLITALKLKSTYTQLEILHTLKNSIVSRDGTTATFDVRDSKVKEWLNDIS